MTHPDRDVRLDPLRGLPDGIGMDVDPDAVGVKGDAGRVEAGQVGGAVVQDHLSKMLLCSPELAKQRTAGYLEDKNSAP